MRVRIGGNVESARTGIRRVLDSGASGGVLVGSCSLDRLVDHVAQSRPDFVIVDAELTYNTGPYQSAVSGMDALCQGVESYWSVHSTGRIWCTSFSDGPAG